MTQQKKSWALIIGGSSGMGYSVARQLLQSGIATMIVGRSKEKLEQARQELSEFGEIESIQSSKADWVTGAIWDVDGGVMAGH